ncbi:hypothetical protein RJ639_009875 [Escallonia herrerae]|uniref:Uncharacterized protein n=1 Tax=Escallonia herrerae TaxID=1293975 RepID=A0AA89AXF8_9ASTE|nr:hypothetical protein RJ639_009875 [Escallonia herrerae]
MKEEEDEYGFHQKGAITLPCHVEEVRHVRSVIDEEEHHHCHHHRLRRHQEDHVGKERFVIPLTYVNHPLFMHLLKEAEDEYGFHQKGAITLLCHVEEFQHVRTMIDLEEHHRHYHHCRHHQDRVGCFGCTGERTKRFT